jgi:hypothetical protein
VAGSESALGYAGHVEQVYLRRQGPNCLSWGCKRVRVWHLKGWRPIWLGLGLSLGSKPSLLGLGAGSESALGYMGHVEQACLRSQGPNRLSWGCKLVRVWHLKGWRPRA